MIEELEKTLQFVEKEIKKQHTQKGYVSRIYKKINNLPLYILQGSLMTVIKYYNAKDN